MANFFRKDGWVKSAIGPAVAGALVYVCTQPANTTQAVDPVTGTPVATWFPTPLATIYSDPDGLVPITQPLETDGFGHYDYYAAADAYTEVVMNAGRVQQVYVDQSLGGAATNGPVFAETKVTHTVTAQEIVQGFAIVPVAWDTPFVDTNYSSVYSVEDVDAATDLSFVTGDMHSITASGFNAVVYMAAAPILIQKSLDAAHVNSVQTITDTAPIDTLYSIQYYVSGYAGGDAGVHVRLTLQYTDLQAPHTFNIDTIVTGANASPDQGTFNLFAVANTAITISFNWSSPSPSSFFTVNARLVRTPNNVSVSVVPGDQFIVHAMAFHN